MKKRSRGIKVFFGIFASDAFSPEKAYQVEGNTRKGTRLNKRSVPDEKKMQRLETLLKNMPCVAYLARNDEAYTMLYLSDGIKALTGYEAQLFLDRKIAYADLIHEAERKKVRTVMDKIIQDGSQLSVEYRIVTKEGRTRWVYEQGSMDDFETKEDNLICGVVLDITSRKKLTEALLLERQRLARVVEGAPDIIFEIDTKKTFVNVYGCGLEKLAMKPEDILGRTLKEVFTQSYVQKDIYYDRALCGENVHYNWVYESADGELHFHSSIGPLYDQAGHIIGAVGIAREITQERKAAMH